MGILLVLVSYFILYPWFQYTMRPDYFDGNSKFNLKIAMDATISNVTLLIPLPVRNGTPQIGSLVLTPSMFEKEGIHASFIRSNMDWYVKITADSMTPSREEFEYRMDQYDSQDYLGLPYLVNTRYPEGNESVFLPKSNVTIEYPVPEISTRFGAEDYYPVVSKYQIPVFVEYTVTNRTDAMRVMLIASVQGYNSWVEQFDSWRMNNYWDEIALTLYDEAHGWYLADGKLKSGEGIYLDRNAFKAN
ncbi:MAG: hypothetical protein LUP99_05670 [Methanomicrobiales archaeon]|nr:hypothetical protein [Methanomicrobiales archaeon]